MKIRISLFFIFLSLYSCREYCDPSTAEGAAECSCKLISDFNDAKGDAEKTKEVSARYDKFMGEYDKNISQGNYTEAEVNELIEKRDNCK